MIESVVHGSVQGEDIVAVALFVLCFPTASETAGHKSVLVTYRTNRHGTTSSVCSIAISRGVTVVLGMVAVCGKSFMAAWNASDRLFSADLFARVRPHHQQAKGPNRISHRHDAFATYSTHAQHNCHALRHRNGAHARSGAMLIGVLGFENYYGAILIFL